MQKFEWNKYLYYVLIGLLSIAVLIFLPMVGSAVNGKFQFPVGAANWCIYILTKLIVAVINILLFYCFMEQAKINVKDNKNFIEANAILCKYHITHSISPRSPKVWESTQYGKKGLSLFLSSILGTFVLGEALLTYDVMSLLTYIFTIFLGIIFGILQMKSAENYWINEFYYYAIQFKEEESQIDKN